MYILYPLKSCFCIDDGLAGLINLINREDTEEKDLRNQGKVIKSVHL